MSERSWQAGLRVALVRELLRPASLARDVEGGWIGGLLGRANLAELRLPLLAAWAAQWHGEDESGGPELPIVHARPPEDSAPAGPVHVQVQAVLTRAPEIAAAVVPPLARARMRPLRSPEARSAAPSASPSAPSAPSAPPQRAAHGDTAPSGERAASMPRAAHGEPTSRRRSTTVELPRVVSAFRRDLPAVAPERPLDAPLVSDMSRTPSTSDERAADVSGEPPRSPPAQPQSEGAARVGAEASAGRLTDDLEQPLVSTTPRARALALEHLAADAPAVPVHTPEARAELPHGHGRATAQALTHAPGEGLPSPDTGVPGALAASVPGEGPRSPALAHPHPQSERVGAEASAGRLTDDLERPLVSTTPRARAWALEHDSADAPAVRALAEARAEHVHVHAPAEARSELEPVHAPTEARAELPHGHGRSTARVLTHASGEGLPSTATTGAPGALAVSVSGEGPRSPALAHPHPQSEGPVRVGAEAGAGRLADELERPLASTSPRTRARALEHDSADAPAVHAQTAAPGEPVHMQSPAEARADLPHGHGGTTAQVLTHAPGEGLPSPATTTAPGARAVSIPGEGPRSPTLAHPHPQIEGPVPVGAEASAGRLTDASTTPRAPARARAPGHDSADAPAVHAQTEAPGEPEHGPVRSSAPALTHAPDELPLSSVTTHAPGVLAVSVSDEGPRSPALAHPQSEGPARVGADGSAGRVADAPERPLVSTSPRARTHRHDSSDAPSVQAPKAVYPEPLQVRAQTTAHAEPLHAHLRSPAQALTRAAGEELPSLATASPRGQLAKGAPTDGSPLVAPARPRSEGPALSGVDPVAGRPALLADDPELPFPGAGPRLHTRPRSSTKDAAEAPGGQHGAPVVAAVPGEGVTASLRAEPPRDLPAVARASSVTDDPRRPLAREFIAGSPAGGRTSPAVDLAHRTEDRAARRGPTVRAAELGTGSSTAAGADGAFTGGTSGERGILDAGARAEPARPRAHAQVHEAARPQPSLPRVLGRPVREAPSVRAHVLSQEPGPGASGAEAHGPRALQRPGGLPLAALRPELPHPQAPAAAHRSAPERAGSPDRADREPVESRRETAPVRADIKASPAAPSSAPAVDIEVIVDAVQRRLTRELQRGRALRRAIRPC